jgi:transcriptional regulator with XRE-family HTH domain
MTDNPVNSATPDKPRLGSLLMHYRHLAKMSQEDLAYQSGVDDTNISKIEQGITRNPQSHTLERLAEALAQNIKGAAKQKILDHLLDAKNRKPEEYKIHPGLIHINDLIKPLHPKQQRIVVDAITDLVDRFMELLTWRNP